MRVCSEKNSNMPFESRQITNICIVWDNRWHTVPLNMALCGGPSRIFLCVDHILNSHLCRQMRLMTLPLFDYFREQWGLIWAGGRSP